MLPWLRLEEKYLEHNHRIDHFPAVDVPFRPAITRFARHYLWLCFLAPKFEVKTTEHLFSMSGHIQRIDSL